MVVEAAGVEQTEVEEQAEGELQRGWLEVTLQQLAQVLRGVSYEKSVARDVAAQGYYPILRATNIQEDHLITDNDLVYVPNKFVKNEQLLKHGDVVVCMSSGSKSLVGKAAQLLQDWDGSFGTFCAAVRFTPEIEPKYAGYFFSSPRYRNFIRSKSAGININNLRHSDIETLRFPLPPLPEQRRIVAKIEELFTQLDAAVAALKRVQANLKRYRAAVLKAACEGKLVPQDPGDEPASQLLARILAERRARWGANLHAKGKDQAKVQYEEPAEPDVGGLPELPEGWVWATVEQIGTIGEQTVLTGPFGSNLGREDFQAQGVPLLTIGCLTEQGLSLEKAFYVSERKASELKNYRVKEGDLLFSRMASVGRAGLVPTHLEGALINYHLMRLRLADAVINPNYFISYVRGSDVVVEYIKDVNHGATRDGINTSQLLALPVTLPPLAEQERIVAEVERRLSVVQELEGSVEASLRRADRLRQAVLNRAFEGRLVPQDPSDEPAGVLLARVRGERGSGAARQASHTVGVTRPIVEPAALGEYKQAALQFESE